MRRYVLAATLLVLPLTQTWAPQAWAGADAVWWLHLVPVAVLAYHHGIAGAAVGLPLSLPLVVAGEQGLAAVTGMTVPGGLAVDLLLPLAVSETLVAGLALQARREVDALRRVALRDQVTGLPNRRLFMERLTHRLERAARNRRPLFSVLMVGMRDFGVVRDALGAGASDEVVKRMADRAHRCVRTSDTVARWSPGKFAVLLDEVDEDDDALTVARRLRDSMEAPLSVDGNRLSLNTDVGIAPGSDSQDPETVVTHADAALRWAQESETDKVGVFDPERQAEMHSRFELEADLREALEHDEFLLEYQPIVDVKSEALAGFEALVRWEHPEHGRLSPGRFIPTAEKNGFIVDLGEYVCLEACRTLARWRQSTPEAREVFITVNLSPKQLAEREFPSRLRSLCKGSGVDPRQLKLEITESVVMGGDETTTESIERLRDAGFQLALDDFGTGHSSLSYLHRVPLRYLKIDRSFIHGLEEEWKHLKILRSVVGMAGDLGYQTVAEGVETGQQESRIRQLGCDYMQGFHFAPPLSRSAAEARLGDAA